MKIHRISSEKQKTKKRSANDLDQNGKIKDKERDKYTVRSMLDDLEKWEDFLSNM